MASIYLFFLLNFSLTLHGAVASCDWPSCKGISNVACDVGGLCVARGGCEMMPHEEKFRREVLHAHNVWRSYMASGNESRGGNAKAADMMALSYDVELEFTARCNVVDCQFDHDKCRATHKFPKAGQNLCWRKGKPVDFIKHAVKCVKDWYEECNDTTAEQIDSYAMIPGAHVGHYTQLVWSRTTHVGCSRATKGKEFVMACNYGTAGNVLTKPVYARGEPCSIEGLKLNAEYPGLCGDIDESGLKAAPLEGYRFSGSIFVSLVLPFMLIVGAL